MKMNLHNFECFITLVDEMNFGKAADKLHITQQTLSGNIKRLEEFYETKFFERRPRLILTPAGRSMLEYAKRAIKHEEYFVSELASITNTTTAKLNMGITGMRATVFMPKIWEIFHRKFPNITISITEAATQELDKL
ncbi:MAG: LysR family transcriptional regulator, partial [Synergistaceae bacterium]|nr:LysR family transcriptional regulator [Synergistaceae bacterium]